MEAVHTDDLRGQILWRLHKFQCELANGFETDGRMPSRIYKLYDIVVRFADQEYIYFMEFQEYIYFMGSWSDRRTWLDRENIYTLWGRKYIYFIGSETSNSLR